MHPILADFQRCDFVVEEKAAFYAYHVYSSGDISVSLGAAEVLVELELGDLTPPSVVRGHVVVVAAVDDTKVLKLTI